MIKDVKEYWQRQSIKIVHGEFGMGGGFPIKFEEPN
jgi:hypothetical protein